MNRFKLLCLAAVSSLVLFTAGVFAQTVGRETAFPDIAGYRTLKCDLHMHTVFSDGSVWPSIRADEAFRLGLDAIAITDHIEYQPHKDDVPTNHNRPYELAVGRARELGVILIRGAEITRDTPPGHFNVIFTQDNNALAKSDLVEAIAAGVSQGAFIFWNHHAWHGEEQGRWLDIHTELYEKKLLHGMEVANGDTYYPTAHKWCLEKGLTMVGNSDIHAPDLRVENTSADHRAITLVFAKERTAEAVLESLKEGRTAVWSANLMIGKPEWLNALAESMLEIDPPHLRSKTSVWVKICNKSSMDLTLKRMGNVGPAETTLKARSTTVVRINVLDASQPIDLEYEITNFLAAPNQGLKVSYTIPAP